MWEGSGYMNSIEQLLTHSKFPLLKNKLKLLKLPWLAALFKFISF